MIINNPEALKGWLTIILEPLCDADPSALARYVFALLKKEKPIKELKKSMNEQLDVFLADETKNFVDRLFEAIASEEYLATLSNQQIDNDIAVISVDLPNSAELLERECTPPVVQQQQQQQQQQNKTKEIQTVRTPTTIGTEETIIATPSTVSSVIEGTQATLNTPSSTVIISPLSSNTLSLSPIKTACDKENHPREQRRRRVSLRSRSRSRSRSMERAARRSRSRDRRPTEREKLNRQFRNKSPPTERRRSDRRIGADRSPRHGGGSNKNQTRSHSDSRSRSGSPERRKISRSTSPTANETGGNNNSGKRQRCRDFDEKGYCVRGETCPWDHGVNPVVLEGINNPALLNMPQHLREYNPDAPELWNRGGNGGGPFSGPRGTFPSSHKTGGGGGAPGIYPRPPAVGFRPAGPPFPFGVNPAATPLQRELISVPVVDANAGGDISLMQCKRRYEPEDTVAIAEGPTKRKVPINSRLGPRVGGTHPQQNCSLELRKIPRGMNTIAHLNNHFSKFGKIVNIQISYDGDAEAAIITFSTHAEANVAYRSTEAVLNNRFIKVFWHSPGNNPDGLTQNVTSKEDNVVNGRKNSQYHINNMTAVPIPAASAEGAKTSNITNSSQSSATGTTVSGTMSSTTTTASTTIPAGGATTNSTTIIAATHIQQSSMRLKNNRPMPPTATNAIIRKKKEEQAKAVVQLAHGLRKRKRELIQEYLKQMKSAVELLERMDQQDPQRPKMLETIKNLQSNIDNLNKELSTEQAQIAAQIQSQPPPKKTKEEQKKELLDIELELFNQQQEGNDTTAIQKRLENLQRSLGISNQKHYGGKIVLGGPRVNNRIRAAPLGATSFDRRPKTLLITGFATDDCDKILGHFKHFGEITKQEIDKSIPQILLSFSTRSTAEQAVARGRLFKDKQLQISWAPPTPPVPPTTQLKELQTNQSTNDNGTSAILVDKTITNDINMETDNLELRLEDEEEDEESEDRSWRR